MKKGRYVVKKIWNYPPKDKTYISYDVYFEDDSGWEFIAEFIYQIDAVKFKKLKNAELEEKGLYNWNLK